MKLKYYLRGLGIGIAVTAFLMGAVQGGKETLSDAQIKERAAQLGMVEESSRTLSQVNAAYGMQEEARKEAPGEQGTQAPEQQLTEESAAQASQPNEQMFVSDGDISVPDKTAEIIQITVDRGDSSESVSRSLEEAGLVEDAGSFDQYLCSNGYAKRICVGTYKIPVGTSEKEIAEIITRKP